VIKKLHDADYPLIIVVLILLCFGLVMIYSSSAVMIGEKKSSFFYFKKQFMWTAISVVFFFFFAMLDYRKLQKFITPAVVITLILLAGVLIFGKEIRGARRWFVFPFLSFQPSELAKFIAVFFLADYLDKNKSRLKYFFKGFLPPLVLIGGIIGLIAVEPDMGIPFIIGLVAIILLFVSGARFSHMLVTAALCAPLAVYAFMSHAFRMERLMAFLDPWKNSQGASYQLVQSIISIGSGGVIGKGPGGAEMSRVFIPDAHTDFIFAVIGEEFGVWGALMVVLFFCVLLQRGYLISKNARDSFGTYLAAGITLTIVVQAFFNIAVCTGCVPTKGIPLPFLSYGGSSLLVTLCATGVLANISIMGKKVIRLR